MNTASSLYIGPNNKPEPRHPNMSYRCHLGNTTIGRSEHHRGCDGKSYGPVLTSRGVPCMCSCHPPTQLIPRPVPMPSPYL
jgi:hypothetical protein